MNKSRYIFTAENHLEIFEFISEGPNGRIKKIVQYSETNTPDVYNLGFGDFNEKTGDIDDTVVTNNEDSQKVLATVAATVYAFTDKHPDAMIYATGTTEIRTRLYRIGITNNLKDIQRDFSVFGLRNELWEEFNTGIHYGAFLIKRKM